MSVVRNNGCGVSSSTYSFIVLGTLNGTLYTFILRTAAYTGPRTYTANWVVVLHVGDATAPGNGWSARTGTVTVNGDEMRNTGASQQSIHNALIAYNKNLQATSTFKDPQQSYLDSITPNLLNQAPGTLLSLIPTQQTEWLWQQRIPLGHLTLLQGQPGIGTSLLATTIAARVTTGQPMPGDTSAKPGNVILITPHDNPGSTIKPRLQAAGGDPSHPTPLSQLSQW